MRNKLTELTDPIDDHNAALGRAVADLQTLLLNRTSIIEKGREIGLRSTAVAKMLSSVKMTFAQAEQGPAYTPEPAEVIHLHSGGEGGTGYDPEREGAQLNLAAISE